VPRPLDERAVAHEGEVENLRVLAEDERQRCAQSSASITPSS
jgi:hypothetical protein